MLCLYNPPCIASNMEDLMFESFLKKDVQHFVAKCGKCDSIIPIGRNLVTGSPDTIVVRWRFLFIVFFLKKEMYISINLTTPLKNTYSLLINYPPKANYISIWATSLMPCLFLFVFFLVIMKDGTLSFIQWLARPQKWTIILVCKGWWFLVPCNIGHKMEVHERGQRIKFKDEKYQMKEICSRNIAQEKKGGGRDFHKGDLYFIWFDVFLV